VPKHFDTYLLRFAFFDDHSQPGFAQGLRGALSIGAWNPDPLNDGPDRTPGSQFGKGQRLDAQPANCPSPLDCALGGASRHFWRPKG
jgi:hypothetical protein